MDDATPIGLAGMRVNGNGESGDLRPRIGGAVDPVEAPAVCFSDLPDPRIAG